MGFSVAKILEIKKKTLNFGYWNEVIPISYANAS